MFDIPLFLPGYLQPRSTNILADPLRGQIQNPNEFQATIITWQNQNLFRYVITPAAMEIAFPKSDMGMGDAQLSTDLR